jgi:mono/diheme cytochrome c family protein
MAMSFRPLSLVLWPALAVLAAFAGPAPQEGRPQPPPLPAAKEQLAPGLRLTLESGGVSDMRDARLASLYVPQGTTASPFLLPGPFKAVWEGFVSVDLGTDCTFSAAGNGAITVTIADKPALQAKGADLSRVEGPSLRLRKGRNKLVVRYESPVQGDAVLRLFWASSDFAREPIPPLSLSHDVNADPLRAQRRVREGRELVAMHRCLKCHSSDFKAPGMPELEMDAPSLAEAGARLNAAWMAQWILDPRGMRPEATMPKLSGIQPQDASDMAAYLATLGKAESDPTATAETEKAGGYLLAEMRCIGCHTLPDKEPAPDRIPLRFLKAKWQPAALRKFLLGPEKHYAWIQMPNFHLKPEEADKLAAFLLSRSQAAPAPALTGDPARGKQQVESRGCVSCHTVTGINTSKAPALKDLKADKWAGGCRGTDFGLSPAQTEAIVAFAATDLGSFQREALPEFAERQFLALRCFACHRRDDRLDAWSDLASETRELEPPKKVADSEFAEIAPAEPWFPSLTWVGEKLKPEWAVAFLKGEIAERPRPFLKNLRMPAFPARAERLFQGLALEHGCPPKSPPEAAPNGELSELGRKLSGPSGGLDCLSCHAIGSKGATKVFEAPAPNFRLARARIRKDYYDRWVREPLRLEPGTKMPQFIKDGRTQLTEILDGDGVKQADALWQYLLEGEKIRPPTE